MPLDTIAAILRNGSLDSLIGAKEDLWFEAKLATGYDLATARGRFELAKDVSAFGNSDGGYLIVGLRTRRLLVENTDEVTDLDLRPRTEMPVERYSGVIRDYIHPSITGLDVRWVGSAANPGEGVLAIFIPAQDEARKYFLTARVFEGTEQVEQAVFGIFRRVNSGNDPFTIAQLYALTQQGRSPVAERLTRMEAKLDVSLAASRPVVDARSQLEERIRRLL